MHQHWMKNKILYTFQICEISEIGPILDHFSNKIAKYFMVHEILNRYIMFGRGICEKYQSRDEKSPEPKGEGNLVSILAVPEMDGRPVAKCD